MKDLVKFPMESGGFVFIETEVSGAEKGGLVRAGRGLPDEAAQSFEAPKSCASSSMCRICGVLISRPGCLQYSQKRQLRLQRAFMPWESTTGLPRILICQSARAAVRGENDLMPFQGQSYLHSSRLS
jgi:hypothetical protein